MNVTIYKKGKESSQAQEAHTNRVHIKGCHSERAQGRAVHKICPDRERALKGPPRGPVHRGY